MLKYYYILVLLLAVVSCGGGNDNGTSSISSDNNVTNEEQLPVSGGSVQFVGNLSGQQQEYARQTDLPAEFGVGEFTFQVWVKPDDTYPIGSTASETGDKSLHWTSEDIEPYSRGDWWWLGNFLLDGHNNSTFQNGTFSIQFYGGGRVRWLFGDGGSELLAVQAYPATGAESLLDGNWHQITLVRRWVESTSAQLELWVDGSLIATEISNNRTNMRTYWDSWDGFIAGQPGWFWGAEKNAAVDPHTYEDYKGLVDELRLWSRALTASEIGLSIGQTVSGDEAGLVGFFNFDEGSDLESCNSLIASQCMTMVVPPQGWAIWATENARIYP